MRIVSFVLLLALVLPALAEDGPEAWLIPFAVAYHPQVSGFNTAFARHNLPQAHSRHFGWGLELRSLSGAFLVGPLFFRTWNDVENDGYRLRTDATGIFGELGVKLSPASFLAIVPMLGLGGINQSFHLRAKTGSIPFDSLLGNSSPQVVSITPGMKLAGMGALELGVVAGTKAGRFGLALRGGYLYSPFAPTWRLANGAEVAGAPADRLGGLFISAGLLMLPAAQTSTQ